MRVLGDQSEPCCLVVARECASVLSHCVSLLLLIAPDIAMKANYRDLDPACAYMVVDNTAHLLPKVENALASPYPTSFDMKNDIFIPGKTDTMLREIQGALQSRNLLGYIVHRAPTLQSIADHNPEFLESTCTTRWMIRSIGMPWMRPKFAGPRECN